MPSSFEKIAGPVAKPLKLGLFAFFVGLSGGALGLAIDYGPNNPLSFFAFALMVIAVATGFFAIAWGGLAIFRHFKRARTDD